MVCGLSQLQWTFPRCSLRSAHIPKSWQGLPSQSGHNLSQFWSGISKHMPQVSTAFWSSAGAGQLQDHMQKHQLTPWLGQSCCTGPKRALVRTSFIVLNDFSSWSPSPSMVLDEKFSQWLGELRNVCCELPN